MVGGARIRVAGVGFAHLHVGDQAVQVLEHPAAQTVGVGDADPAERRQESSPDAEADHGIHRFDDPSTAPPGFPLCCAALRPTRDLTTVDPRLVTSADR